jgi:hypothetical protein
MLIQHVIQSAIDLVMVFDNQLPPALHVKDDFGELLVRMVLFLVVSETRRKHHRRAAEHAGYLGEIEQAYRSIAARDQHQMPSC